jgi:hypothetical protein
MRSEYRFFAGRLTRPPTAGKPVLAKGRFFLLHTKSDFRSMELAGNPERTRVLVSIAEKYRLLEAIVAAATAALPGIETILIATAHVPGGATVPTSLLVDRILFCSSVCEEMERLTTERRSFFCIEDGIVCRPVEHGHNEICFTWFPSQDAGGDFEKFLELMPELGIQELRRWP